MLKPFLGGNHCCQFFFNISTQDTYFCLYQQKCWSMGLPAWRPLPRTQPAIHFILNNAQRLSKPSTMKANKGSSCGSRAISYTDKGRTKEETFQYLPVGAHLWSNRFCVWHTRNEQRARAPYASLCLWPCCWAGFQPALLPIHCVLTHIKVQYATLILPPFYQCNSVPNVTVPPLPAVCLFYQLLWVFWQYCMSIRPWHVIARGKKPNPSTKILNSLQKTISSSQNCLLSSLFIYKIYTPTSCLMGIQGSLQHR